MEMRIALCSYSQKEKETALLMKLGKVDRFDNGVFWRAVWPVSSASPAVSPHLPLELQPQPMPMKEGRIRRV